MVITGGMIKMCHGHRSGQGSASRADLRRRIAAGEWELDEALPTTAALASTTA